ncbi:hypothetical protein [Paracoccus sanguinis]|uniref:hypothetical protein n=1 Tax=Paracoccus sanguinis TaxID=1545044 RepID=UPI0009427BCE|nr:hypothetical protein [Paracoccus sanguinis]
MHRLVRPDAGGAAAAIEDRRGEAAEGVGAVAPAPARGPGHPPAQQRAQQRREIAPSGAGGISP